MFAVFSLFGVSNEAVEAMYGDVCILPPCGKQPELQGIFWTVSYSDQTLC